MPYGPTDHYCRKGCTAIFADRRERNSHEDECQGDLLNDWLNKIATESVNGGSE